MSPSTTPPLRAEAMPRSIAPMLLRLSAMPTDPSRYAFEVKWDGFRCLAFWDGKRLRLQNRNQRDLTPMFPELQSICQLLGRRRAILDGELVCFDPQGRPCFDLLQPRLPIARPGRLAPAQFIAFDVLYLGRGSTMGLPYTRRRELLESLRPEWRRVCHRSLGGRRG